MSLPVHVIGRCVDGPTPAPRMQVGGRGDGGSDVRGRGGGAPSGVLRVGVAPGARQGRTVVPPVGGSFVLGIAVVGGPENRKEWMLDFDK